jgi:hypothetical protein
MYYYSYCFTLRSKHHFTGQGTKSYTLSRTEYKHTLYIYWIKQFKNLPEHNFREHESISVSFPSQFEPPCAGSGLLHSWYRDIDPLPHVA